MTSGAEPSGAGSFGACLTPCFILVPKPKARDYPKAIASFEGRLLREFSGATKVGETNGMWLDPVGMRCEDHSVVYVVAIDWSTAAQITLRAIVEQLAADLFEQCVLLAVGSMPTYLIWATNEVTLNLASEGIPHGGEVTQDRRM